MENMEVTYGKMRKMSLEVNLRQETPIHFGALMALAYWMVPGLEILYQVCSRGEKTGIGGTLWCIIPSPFNASCKPLN